MQCLPANFTCSLSAAAIWVSAGKTPFAFSLVVIGTDSPLLPPRFLREALAELQACDAVLGPCPDGGYYLIGSRRLDASTFCGIRWSTPHAFESPTLRVLVLGP
jgi:glycosyltransferase A (GT-A) superfamily protein (DUF2064 family)